ncbi:hypothetical protein ACF1HJ_41085 [Streptomyces sp. NPDC013978]|uniref:hypothetical protein n=1 Tax=Streptomyces sp. NPDC013978 TaxID=3364869 RepID=UPI0036FCB4BB
MSSHDGRRETRSPLISPRDLAQYGALPSPTPPTEAELAAVLDMLTSNRPRIEAVAVGHSRDEVCRAAAEAFTSAWRARGGTVLTTVHWPEKAASWLRPATRLTAGEPDAWVIAASVPGFAQLARRLGHSTDWDPGRTYAFATLSDSRLPALVGPRTVHGMRGATADGGTWEVRHGWVTFHPPV